MARTEDLPTAWQTTFKEHALWGHVRTADQVLRARSTGAVVPAPDRARMRRVITALQSHARQNSDLYTPAMLDALMPPIVQLSTSLAQFKADPKTLDHFTAASGQLDAVVQTLATLPPLPAGRQTEANERIAELNTQIDALKVSVNDLETELVTLREMAADDVTAKVEQVGDALLAETRAAFAEPLAETRSAKATVDAELAEIRALKLEALNIAEALSEKAVAKDYAENARNKSIAGWVWDVAGTVMGAFALGLLGYHLLSASTEATVPSAMSRLAVAIAGIGLAALCFVRARSFHAEARLAKRTQIRVDTVRGFVANLDPETREAVVEGMAERIYMLGQLDPVGSDDPSFVSLESMKARIRSRRGTSESTNAEQA